LRVGWRLLARRLRNGFFFKFCSNILQEKEKDVSLRRKRIEMNGMTRKARHGGDFRQMFVFCDEFDQKCIEL
jgi:hypothetical protein